MYSGVPITTPAMVRLRAWESIWRAFAIPKSMSFENGGLDVMTNTFSGLRSRCTTPSACAASRARENLPRIVARCADTELALALEDRRQGLSFEELHDDVGDAVFGRLDIDDLHDVAGS